MRNRDRRRPPVRARRRGDSDDGSESRGGDDGGRTNAGPAPEWDGTNLSFQDYAIKAKLWLATTRSKPRTRGPLLLQKLSKTPFETMKFLARDSSWMESPTNGEDLLAMMDRSEYFGDDKDEDLLGALAKITYHVRRERGESHRDFFNRWETAMRKTREHMVTLPEKYTGFLLINALTLSESDIKAMLNYTRGSILPQDVKEWIRKHETKLHVSQVGLEQSKKTSSSTTSKASGNYFMDEEETDQDEEVFALESALRDLQDDSHHEESVSTLVDDGSILEEHEAAEILNTMLMKKRSFVQTQKAKKLKELGRGYHSGSSSKGKGKSYSVTGTGRPPFKTGHFKMTIEELKKVTKCGNCHKTGHWHRECPEPPREREQHYLESEEVIFCGMLEKEDPTAAGVQADFDQSHTVTGEESFVSSPTVGDMNHPSEVEGSFKPMSPYNDRDVFLGCREVFFSEDRSQAKLESSSNHHPQSPESQDHEDACATVDTGCQRMAIGIETLRRLSHHLPDPLSVQLHRQEHRFRSVHGRSSTKHVASIPSALGSKGSLLKPAVFEDGVSKEAPFLISLPFLMFCRAVMFLDPEEGLKIHFRKFKFTVRCHIGPTGALRVPLCEFSKQQIQQLYDAQLDQQKNHKEFEILRTDHVSPPKQCGPKQSEVGNVEPQSTPLSVEAEPDDGARPQKEPITNRSYGANGCMEAAGDEGDVCDLSSDLSGPSGDSRITSSTGTINTKEIYNNVVRSDLSVTFTDKESGVQHGRTGDGHGPNPSRSGATTSMRARGDHEALHLPEARAESPSAVLEVPDESDQTVQGLCVVRETALPGPEVPLWPGDRGEPDVVPSELFTNQPNRPADHGGPTSLSTLQCQQVRNQCLSEDCEVQQLRQDTCQREDRAGIPKGTREEEQQGISCPRADHGGLSGVEEIRSTTTSRNLDGPREAPKIDTNTVSTTSDLADNKILNKGVRKVLRQAQAALSEAETLWKEIITHVQPSPDSTSEQTLEKFVLQLFDDSASGPKRIRSKKTLRQFASLVGVTNKQARTVAEVFNPNRFCPYAKKHNLEPGIAFDVELGTDLLEPKKRTEVRKYLKHVKPGLTVVSAPCTMFSALQNLNMKYLDDPAKQTEFTRRLIEAKVLMNFACEVCRIVMSYGGTFLFEQPWTSKAWHEARVQELINLEETYVIKNDQCMFGLRAAEGGLHRKPTGWMTNNEHIAQSISVLCDQQHQHVPVIGSGPGGSRSKRAQQYPVALVNAILKAYSESINQHQNIYLVTLETLEEQESHVRRVLQESEEPSIMAVETVDDDQATEVGDLPPGRDLRPQLPGEDLHHEEAQPRPLPEGSGEDQHRLLPRERPLSVEQLVRRAHCGLGHIGNDRLARILQTSGARTEAVNYAKTLQCDVCLRHKRVAPPRAAAPPKELKPNQAIGVDTVWLPGLQPGGRLRMALNVICWSTRFQLVLPLRDHTPRGARQALYQWFKIFGVPEIIYSDLGKEFQGCFEQMTDQQAIILDPGSLESPTQRSLTERAGKNFKEILSRTLMEVTCKTWEEWEEAVDIVTATVNRLANKSGFSPVQRMLGYSPRIPGTLLSGGYNDQSTTSRYLAGDQQVQRSMKLREAAAIAYHKADCDQALKNALHAGPRVWHNYEVGQTVYYWKKGMERAKKDNPSFWHGPSKVILTNLPTTVWVAHRGRIIKASPEHLRPATDEEKFVLTDWIQDIVETKNQIRETDFKGYIVLEEKPPGLHEEGEEQDTQEHNQEQPSKRPRFRLTGKHDYRTVEFSKEEEGNGHQAQHDQELPEIVGAEYSPTTAPAEEPMEEDQKIEEEPAIDLEESTKEMEIEKEPQADQDDQNSGEVRPREAAESSEERPTKRVRTEFLEILQLQLDQVLNMKKRKEMSYRNMCKEKQQKFDKAILKEIKNNLQSGAYEALDRERSEVIRRDKAELIMKSRYVLTEKAVEPHEVEPLREEGLLIHSDEGEVVKAKARHVMKGYSEAGAEELESTTPQVAKESVVFTLQLLASNKWTIGHLDFTQAFHSGDQIQRELYCSLPPEGVPGLHPRQVLRLRKTCYGLTDGPWAWYRHLCGVLESRGYVKSRADPCLFFLLDEQQDQLEGIISLATDDMIHGGTDRHWDNMEWLRGQYRMGKYTKGNGKFTGKMVEQNDDGSILLHQKTYIEEKIHLIPINRTRKRQRYSRCTAEEVNQMRTLIGGLAWVSKETRPDISGRVALLQQTMPTPMVKDLVEANSVAEELKKNPGLGIRIQPIPLDRLRVGVITDASWGNAGASYLENNEKDFWEETETSWIRHHVLPRRLYFHPGAAPHGPDLHSISRKRTTWTSEEVIEDHWDGIDGIREHSSESWTGTTTFLKTEVAEEVNRPINERFLQLSKQHSQGGYILIYYDANLEITDQLEMITIASWKSYKLKRCTVNTLSAECQSMLQGIGSLHWHRYLLLESLGCQLQLGQWESQIKEVPFIAVTDSWSLYDTITKCRNTSAHIDDKRTAIDLTILKSDLEKTKGQVRWVGGSNMVSDSLTKKMTPGFLRKIMLLGKWSLTETGYKKLLEIHALFNIKCGR